MTLIDFDSNKIDKYYEGKYSDADSSYVNEVFCQSGKEKELERHLRRQWYEILNGKAKQDKNLDHILYRIHYDINTRLSTRNAWSFSNILKWSSRIAAVVLLPIVILVGIHFYNETNLKNEAWVEINAPAWTRIQFSLPDGTKGWLNSKSSVKYNGKFLTNRQVTLNGEAYFDVFKDKTRPFIVNTDDVIVRVLGTKFNMASYENERNVEVVLEEGKIELNEKGMRNTKIVNPNELVIFDKTLRNFSTEVVRPEKYISWTEGKLEFRNDPLDIIARRLERWYGIDIEINGTISQQQRLRATFFDENLEEVLYLLKRTMPIDYIILDRNLRPDETYATKKVIITSRAK